jgi:D-alanine-D-alanine ligase
VTRAIRRVAVLTGDHGLADATKRDGRYNEEDLATHAAMREALLGLAGFDFRFWTEHARLFELLERERPDLVVNFCDTGFRNVAARELHVPAYLELLDVPYTGATPAAIATCYDKEIVRLVARAHGVAVPREHFLSPEAGEEDLPDLYPALLKPNQADGSLGITQHAVVRSPGDARRYLAWLRETLPGRDVLVQEYLPGPEYGIGLLGNPQTALEALPALQVDFSRLPGELAPILSYESKALPDSPYWTQIRFERAVLAPEVEARLVDGSKRLFRRLGLRDYARFDFRTSADGEIVLMEVNPNPAWANDGKLAFMAGFAGLSYRDLLHAILEAALERIGA